MAKNPDTTPEPAARPGSNPADPADLGTGHAAEPAAASGTEPEATPGLSPPGQGAQVILTGDAQDAARGGPHGDIVSNTVARDAAIAEGHVAPGTTAEAAANATTGQALPDDDDPNASEVDRKSAAERRARQTKP